MLNEKISPINLIFPVNEIKDKLEMKLNINPCMYN